MSCSSPTNWPIHSFETLDSTSDEARRRVIAGENPLPYVIEAKRQTRGRGRGLNSWWSAEGSLLFTLALDPVSMGIEPRHESRLALIAALAIIDSLPGLSAGIRWPNDVEVDDRKLAGILPERVQTDQGIRLLIGVGVNVSTRFDTAPEEVRRLATSVLMADPASQPDPTLLVRFLDHFDVGRRLLVEESCELVGRWNALDTLSGRRVHIRQGDRLLSGIGQGIDADGGLILETDQGPITVYGGQVLRD